MLSKTKGTLLLGASTILFALIDGAPAVAESAGGASTIETVVVTAEKRAEKVQDLPIAISAFSGDTLESAGVDGVRSLQDVTPSLDVGSKGSETFISIRGVGTEIASIGSEPGVTLSQDGVALASHLFFNSDFLDVDRVEVLRGPQGTISGRNATGGAINIISRLPTDALEASLTATGGNYGRFSSRGVLSGPIAGDSVLGRIAFSTDNADGWLRDIALGQKLGSTAIVHGRGTILAHLTDTLTAVLQVEGLADHSRPQSTANIGRARPDVPSLGEAFGVADASLRNFTLAADQPRVYSRHQTGVGLRITWNVADATTLTSTTAYWKTDVHDAQDTDGTVVSLGDFPFWHWNIQQVSQELTLATDITSRLDLILGGLYLQEGSKQPLEFVAAVLGIGPGNYFVLPVQNLTSYAGYGQLRYRITDELQVSAGLRYTDDTKTYFESGVIFAPISGGGKASWDALTPRFSLDYKPQENLSFYVNVARGFTAGGFNTLNFAPVDAFKPEFVWSYEAGLKGNVFDDRLSFATSAYYMDYSNLQETFYTPGPFGVPAANVQNVPNATIKGIELELDGQVTDSLKLGLSADWLSTRVGSFLSLDPVFPELGIRNFGGNRLPRAPNWQFTLNGQYTFGLTDDLSAALRGDYSWRAHQFFEIYNHPLVGQNAYGLLNLNASISDASGHWEVEAWGHNVIDQHYLNNGFASVIIPGLPMNLASFGEPAMYGVNVTYRY